MGKTGVVDSGEATSGVKDERHDLGRVQETRVTDDLH
jgi:hypothetical protein